MVQKIQGSLEGNKLKIGVVVARFNELITKNLLSGALDALERHGVKENSITVVWVPGSFEVTLIASKMAKTDQYDAIVCLGTIIRGQTPHFDIIANQSAAGIMQASLATGVPMIFGILTTDTIEQAIERAGTKAGNKGYDAAVAAIEMANLVTSL